MLLGMLLMAVVVVAAPAAVAAPGVPTAPTVVYTENFENGVGATPVLLPAYTGAGGQTYTADPAWLTACNGAVVEFASPDAGQAASGCAALGDYSRVRQLAYALGVNGGAADPTTNHGVTAYTEGNPGANLVEFQTVSDIPLPTNGRFLTFRVDGAAVNCFASAPEYQFYLTSGATATPVGGLINACTSPNTVNVPAQTGVGAIVANVGSYTSNGALLFTGSAVGIKMTNANGSGGGNDAAFDNIRIVDATPSLDKSFSPADLNVGDSSRLTFTITNTSELGSKAGWSFTDNLPSGLKIANSPGASTTCTNGVVNATAGGSSIGVSGDLNVGQTSCTVSVNVTSSAPGTYTNGPGNVSTTGLNPPPPAVVTFRAADLEITKSADPTPVVPGDDATYSLKVTNKGPDTATNIKVVDQLPSGLSFVSASSGCAEASKTVTCTLGSLASGASHTFTISTKVASSANNCDDLRNTATVSSDVTDLEPTNNSSTFCQFELRSDLSITKTPSAANVSAGGQVMYTLVVKNNGPSDDTGVKVTDPMAPGLTLVSAKPSQGTCSTLGGKVSCDLGGLAAGGSAQAQVLVTAQVSATGGSIANTATVTGGNKDPDPKDNTTTTTITVTPPPEPQFDLAVTKTAASKSVYVGQPLKYTITVTNKGPDAAPSANVKDTLNSPAAVVSVKASQGTCTKSIPMTCQLGTIKAGGKVTITATVKLRDNGCKQRNAASATGDGTDTNPTNNLARVDVCAKAVPLRLTKVADSASVRAGGLVSYTIRVSNPTVGEAQDVDVCDKLPSGLVYVSSKAKAKYTKGQYCWHIGTLGAHKSQSYRITVRALGSASGSKVNRATADGKGAKTVHAKDPVRVLGARASGGGVTG